METCQSKFSLFMLVTTNRNTERSAAKGEEVITSTEHFFFPSSSYNAGFFAYVHLSEERCWNIDHRRGRYRIFYITILRHYSAGNCEPITFTESCSH